MMLVLFLFLCLLHPSFVLSSENCNNLTIDEDTELERQLKLLNKPAIKTMVDNGDIYDCVDIYKQPAFDHPSLKDHKLQLRPNSYPVGAFDGISSSSSIEIGLKDGGCPSGTVPIKRVTKDDLIRMRSSLKQKKKMIMMHSLSNSNDDPEYQDLAVLKTLDGKPFKFYGAFASIGAYGLPQVKAPQYSSSLIWLENSMDKHQFNILSAGWSVEPRLYGDSQTRLATAWTNDGFHGTGCHDVVCPGFVQVSSEIPVGTPIGPLSIIHGQQYSLDTYIYLDQPTKNWWLILGKDKKAIGYWPSNIFSTLGQYATQLQFGGVVGYSGTNRPPMGSGLPAELGAGSACYFKRVQYVNEQNQLLDLKPSDTFEHETYPDCYQIGNYVETRDVERNMFYFGGDGHC